MALNLYRYRQREIRWPAGVSDWKMLSFLFFFFFFFSYASLMLLSQASTQHAHQPPLGNLSPLPPCPLPCSGLLPSQRLIHSTWCYFAAGSTHLAYDQPLECTSNSLGATSLWPAGLPKAIKYRDIGWYRDRSQYDGHINTLQLIFGVKSRTITITISSKLPHLTGHFLRNLLAPHLDEWNRIHIWVSTDQHSSRFSRQFVISDFMGRLHNS